MFFTTFPYLQGQVDTVIYGRAPNERKILSPSILGDKPGETEEFRRFLNENLDMSLVADTNLKKGYVFIDCKRKRIRPLKYHADFSSKFDYIYIFKTLVVDPYFTINMDIFQEIIHAVKAAQQRRLAAAGGAYQCRYCLLGDAEINVLEPVKRPIVKVQILCLKRKIFHYPNFPCM